MHSFAAQKEESPLNNEGNFDNWDYDEFPIVVDSVASHTMTPQFEDPINPTRHETKLKGIGNGKIIHVGTVRWAVEDINWNPTVIEDTVAYYSKDAPYRLLCLHSRCEILNQNVMWLEKQRKKVSYNVLGPR